jgi:hypothetical protein
MAFVARIVLTCGPQVKIGNVGERGDPAPDTQLDPALQDRGFLVSDNLMESIPVEYGSANPIFGGFVRRNHSNPHLTDGNVAAREMHASEWRDGAISI